jgi:hypothetical protein
MNDPNRPAPPASGLDPGLMAVAGHLKDALPPTVGHNVPVPAGLRDMAPIQSREERAARDAIAAPRKPGGRR